MLSILRTIAIIDIATNAALAGVAWLFGMTWTQTVGAGLVALIVLVVVLGWRAVVNAPRPKPRTDWQHIGCDPVAPPLAAPYRPHIKVEAPERKLLEAPRKEIQAP